jgi:hypothetical protein
MASILRGRGLKWSLLFLQLNPTRTLSVLKPTPLGISTPLSLGVMLFYRRIKEMVRMNPSSMLQI